MLNTYLNDNQHRPYPFYGGKKLSFPMSCITGLGVCLWQNVVTPVFASVVSISVDSVRVALCRYLNAEKTEAEFIGMVYADLTGYYSYIDSTASSEVFEVTFPAQTVDNRRVVYITPGGDDDPNARAFYALAAQYRPGESRSAGYMQLGVIPEDAVGVYTGEFYLDPSCVSFMPESVFGYHSRVIVNGILQDINHALEISASGLLTLTVRNNQLLFGCLESADINVLNEYPAHKHEFIEFINGTTTANLTTLHIKDDSTTITWTVEELEDTVVLSVSGHNDFPNCYSGEDQA